MKTKNTVLTLVAIAISAFAFAAKPASKMVVLGKSSGLFTLIYEGATAGNVTMKIYDSSGQEIFSETTRGLSKFIRPLNFSDMESGVYSIEITDETGTQAQKVTYEKAEFKKEIKKSSIKALHVCKLAEEGKYLLSISNEGKEQINVRILDNDYNLLHEENRTVNGDLGVVYSLKGFGWGPVFMITDSTGKNHVFKK